MQRRLLDFLLFHVKSKFIMQIYRKKRLAKSLNACERIVFNKFQEYILQI